MSAAVWMQTTAAGTAILGSLGVGVRYLTKHYLSELKPNHGSSLSDTIRLEILPLIRELREAQVEIQVSVAELKGRFDQHIIEGD